MSERLSRTDEDYRKDPETGDFYPWWRVTPTGEVRFDPNKYDPTHPYPARGDVMVNTTTQKQLEDPFDLDNLRFIRKGEVNLAVQKLIEKGKENEGKSLICFVGTGGTLSMTKKGDVLVPTLSPEQLIQEAGSAGKDIVSASVMFPKLIDSSQMEIDYVGDVVIAMSRIYEELRREDAASGTNLSSRFGGFVVCHGTDTATESQTYMSFMLGPNCPYNVLYAVAQKTVEDDFNDVGGNIRLALEAIRFLQKAKEQRQKDGKKFFGIQGICAGGTQGGVYNGSTSQKISDRDPVLLKDHRDGGETIKAFRFGGDANLQFYDSLGAYSQKFGEESIWSEIIDSTDSFRPIILRGCNDSVIQIDARMGDNPVEIAKRILDPKVKAVILKTFGSFTFNRKIVDQLTAVALEKGKIVFATNPFPDGSVGHEYADAKYLIGRGVVPLKMLPHAAFAKLLLAYSLFGDNSYAIIHFMTNNNYCNEQMHDAPESLDNKDIPPMQAPAYLSAIDFVDILAINDPNIRKFVDKNRELLQSSLSEVVSLFFRSKNIEPKADVSTYVGTMIDDTELLSAVIRPSAFHETVISCFVRSGVHDILEGLFGKDEDLKNFLEENDVVVVVQNVAKRIAEISGEAFKLVLERSDRKIPPSIGQPLFRAISGVKQTE